MQDLDDRLPEAVVEDDRLDGHADVGVDRDDGGNLLQLAQGLPLEAWRSTSHVAWGLAEGGGVSICVFGCVFCVYSLVGWIHSVSCVSGPPNLCIAHLGPQSLHFSLSHTSRPATSPVDSEP